MTRDSGSTDRPTDSEQIISRRELFKAGAATALAATLPLLPAYAAQREATSQDEGTLDSAWRHRVSPDARILLKGGAIVSMDPKVGDFVAGDVLIEGTKITGVAANGRLKVPAQTQVIDASRTIIIPGFEDRKGCVVTCIQSKVAGR